MRHMIDIDGSKLRNQREQLGLSQAKLSELAEVPQHLLSSFELGKLELPEKYQRKLHQVLNDNDASRRLIARKKRYRQHEYFVVKHDATRAARCLQTQENSVYLKVIEGTSQRTPFRETECTESAKHFLGLWWFQPRLFGSGLFDGGASGN